TGRAELPAHAPPEYRDALVAWRRLVTGVPAPLEVVAGHDAFAGWRRRGGPPALLKIHGSLTEDQSNLVDVVVVDTEELGQLTEERLAATERLSNAARLLITGYSGADPDVYQPLLNAIWPGHADWYCYSLPPGSSVPADAAARGIRLVLGDPDGLAVTAFRELLGLSGDPHWPSLELAGEGYRKRFDRWAQWIRSRHPP